MKSKELTATIGATVYGWVPPYDNYDGVERFWRMYELSRLSEEEIVQVNDNLVANDADPLDDKDALNGNWEYVWAVSIYYSVLVIGGNEMQPA